jgi:hypothetical protein
MSIRGAFLFGNHACSLLPAANIAKLPFLLRRT